MRFGKATRSNPANAARRDVAALPTGEAWHRRSRIRARHAAGSHRRAAATGLGVPPWLGAAAAGTPDPAVATPASTSGGGATPRQAAAARLTRHLSSGSGGARQRHHASPCGGATPEPTTVPRLASQGDKAWFGGSCKHCPVAQRVAQVQHCGSGTPRQAAQARLARWRRNARLEPQRLVRRARRATAARRDVPTLPGKAWCLSGCPRARRAAAEALL